jgi:hypothetical protein
MAFILNAVTDLIAAGRRSCLTGLIRMYSVFETVLVVTRPDQWTKRYSECDQHHGDCAAYHRHGNVLSSWAVVNS